MRNVKKIYHIDKVVHMINVEHNVLCGETCRNQRCFVAKSVLSQFTLFCRKICFVRIHALLCGEKLNQKLCLWRKKDKYQVCPHIKILSQRHFGIYYEDIQICFIDGKQGSLCFPQEEIGTFCRFE